jgi:hypothetical protein
MEFLYTHRSARAGAHSPQTAKQMIKREERMNAGRQFAVELVRSCRCSLVATRLGGFRHGREARALSVRQRPTYVLSVWARDADERILSDRC